MSNYKLQALSKKITRCVFFFALVNVILASLILSIVRPVLVDTLTQGYLHSLGNYVKQDIRYTLLVQDSVTTSEYVDNFKQFPWMQGIEIQGADEKGIYLNGSVSWTPSISDYENKIHTIGSSIHVLEVITATPDDEKSDPIGFVHIEADSTSLTNPVNWAFMAIATILIVGSLILAYLVISIIQAVLAESTAKAQ